MCLIRKFCEKKVPKFWTKKTFFGFESAPLNLSNDKTFQKNKVP